MIILISGSVGSGKTTIANLLGKKLNLKVVHLNEKIDKFKLNYDKTLETFDFDLDAFLIFIEKEIERYRKNGENIILESHFAHFINPNLVDVLFVINRDLRELKEEYIKRGYNEQKIKDNLEVESFNLCFYEAIEEGYGEEVEDLKGLNNNSNGKTKVFAVENNKDLDLVVGYIIDIIKKLKFS